MIQRKKRARTIRYSYQSLRQAEKLDNQRASGKMRLGILLTLPGRAVVSVGLLYIKSRDKRTRKNLRTEQQDGHGTSNLFAA